jgi:hypothetical protein
MMIITFLIFVFSLTAVVTAGILMGIRKYKMKRDNFYNEYLKEQKRFEKDIKKILK